MHIMVLRYIFSFILGLSFTVALAAGVIRPWRGLVILFAAGVITGAAGLVPGLDATYVAAATAAGAAALYTVEEARRRWHRDRHDAVRTGGQMLLATAAALLLGGVILGPPGGLALAGVTGALAAACPARRGFLKGVATMMVWPLMRLGALFLPAVLLGGRLLGLF